MRIKRVIIISLIYALSALTFAGCNSDNISSSENQNNDNLTDALQRAVSLMPVNYKEVYKYDSFPIPAYNLIPYYGIKQDYQDPFYSELDRLIAKDLGICIDSLMEINRLNTSFEPGNSMFYKQEGWLIYNKDYNSLKTQAKASIFLVYKNADEYYTYHFLDTIPFNSYLIAFDKKTNPTLYGQIARESDCIRNYSVVLTNSIRLFHFSECTVRYINKTGKIISY